MSKHTPGPWKADIRSGCIAVYPACEDHNCLAGMSRKAIHYVQGEWNAERSRWEIDPEVEANARLIAAAPELLEACKSLLSIADESDGVSGYHLKGDIATWGEFDAVDSARAAIRKAEEGAEG